MIATTIEQSKHLLRLGLEPKTADMVWMCNKWLYSIKDNILNQEQFSEQDTLAWSLSALLDVMPKRFDTNCLKLERGLLSDKWFCQYWGGEFFTNEDPVTAAYEMVCWLLEQGFIEKGGNDANTSKS